MLNEEEKKRLIRKAMKNRLNYSETIDQVISDIGELDIPDYDKETFDRNLDIIKQLSSSITNTYGLFEEHLKKATEDWDNPLAIIDKNGITPTVFIILLSFLRVLRSTAKGIDNLAEAVVKKGYTTNQQPQEDPSKEEIEKGDDFLVTLLCEKSPFLKDLSDEDKKGVASGAVKALRNVNNLLDILNTEEQHEKLRAVLQDVTELLGMLNSKD